MQRSKGKPGAGLGKTTGWIHRANLRKAGVVHLTGVSYRLIDGAGIHIGAEDGETQVVEVDNVIFCAGQIPKRDLYDSLKQAGHSDIHVIGGAHRASELDAKEAINQGARLAATM